MRQITSVGQCRYIISCPNYEALIKGEFDTAVTSVDVSINAPDIFYVHRSLGTDTAHQYGLGWTGLTSIQRLYSFITVPSKINLGFYYHSETLPIVT